jgi:hypothetical protein
LENFIVDVLGRRNGLEGSIGTYSLGTISYNMTGNSWCENIGRAHKSNNIIWNVHLIDRVFWQCCHDPDCRGFRGEHIDLPEEVDMEIDDYFLDLELASLCMNGQNGPEKHDETAADKEFDDPVLEEAFRKLNFRAAAAEIVYR